ncbi:hypothetical protein [Ureibacillus manganicus]|uniref:Uncharacterized protein n=1 Tax=Ureibacillus manganicus DSM 26584 TaxID=1384049 RepID=A0A0A3HQM3_9BACL|nr:hypothetical protein [Ureibacillus manganicus]KGR73530.1 hypothetical protein CD29_19795 [Ureibacillus manganicus DSM 26584]
MEKKEKYLTTAPEERKVTIENDSKYPNLKNIPGNSVDQFNELKEANAIFAQEEIKQQNENL